MGGIFTISGSERYWLVAMIAFRFLLADEIRLDRTRRTDLTAAEVARKFGDEMRLLADLGWFDRQLMAALETPFANRDEYEVTLLPPTDLATTLERLRADALAGSAYHLKSNPQLPKEQRQERRAAFQRAAQICGDLLARLDNREERSQ
jgi:hypothetical protein